MSEASEGRTSRAIIRDAALVVISEQGPAATLRSIAARAGVSPALVVKHYGSREGVIAAVDAHVLEVLGEAFAALGQAVAADAPDSFLAAARPLADPTMSRYLSYLLLENSDRSRAAYRQLQGVARSLTADAVGDGEGDLDRDHLAAVLLAHELAVVLLRDRLTEVLGEDPMSHDGLRRWWRTIERLYGGAVPGVTADRRTIV